MTRRTVALCACARSAAAAANENAASRIATARRVTGLQRLVIIEFCSVTTTMLDHLPFTPNPRRRPFLDDGGERVEAVGQRRRPRLQNEGRFDLAQEALAHGGNIGEARARRDLPRHELPPAPGADDDVRVGGDQILTRYDAFLGVLAPGQRGEWVDAAGDFDELGDPADAGDHRLVPFLEIDPGMAGKAGGALP